MVAFSSRWIHNELSTRYIDNGSFFRPFWTGRDWRLQLIQTRDMRTTVHGVGANKEPSSDLTKPSFRVHCALKSELGIVTSVLYRMIEYTEMVKGTTLNFCSLTTFFFFCISILVSTCFANEDYLYTQYPLSDPYWCTHLSCRRRITLTSNSPLENYCNLKIP